MIFNINMFHKIVMGKHSIDPSMSYIVFHTMHKHLHIVYSKDHICQWYIYRCVQEFIIRYIRVVWKSNMIV